jgi:hypothetical protein
LAPIKAARFYRIILGEETFTTRAGLLSMIVGSNSLVSRNEPGKVIDGEAQLIAVLTGFSFTSGAA